MKPLLQPHTQLWAGVCKKTPCQAYFIPMSEHSGVHLPSQLQEKVASRCYWERKSTSSCTCSPDLSSKQSSNGLISPSAFFLSLDSQDVLWVFSAFGHLEGVVCRVESKGDWPPCSSPSCMIVQRLQSSSGDFIKQLQIYSSRWNDKTFQ